MQRPYESYKSNHRFNSAKEVTTGKENNNVQFSVGCILGFLTMFYQK
jgi:hypothetical protein